MIAPTMTAPAKVATTEDGADAPPALGVEVEHEVFLSVLEQPKKPLVVVHHGCWPKTYRYYLRHAGYFFLYRSREEGDFAGRAALLSVRGFHASPAVVG